MHRLRTTSAVGASLFLGVLATSPAQATPSPRTPIILSVTASHGQVLIAWIAPPRRGSTVLGYQLADRRHGVAATRWEPWRTLERPASSRLAALGADPRSQHQLRLRARTVAGWGPWTAIHDITLGRSDRPGAARP
jgi:hypothetical protein